jgi:hypothetical protein
MLKKLILVSILLLVISCKKEVPPNSIPFSTSKGVPIIIVDINGKPARLLIDTGATTSVIDSSIVKEYGFRVGANLDIDFNGIGGRASMYYVDQAITTFNGEPMYIRYRASNMRNIRNSLGIVGIIGTNYLEQNKMIINYEDKLLTIKDK